MALRQDDLCPGPLDCESSKEARCLECSEKWETEDTSNPGICPNCDSNQVTIERCPNCPLHKLDELRLNSDAGRLLDRVLDLEFSIEKFHLGWDDVTAEETKALTILADERNKRREEQKDEDEMERKRQNFMKQPPPAV